jgi:hypothetical protein
VSASLPRADQQNKENKENLYLHGLMLDGWRKSMQPMGGRPRIDYQQVQQFAASSPRQVDGRGNEQVPNMNDLSRHL